MDYGLKGRTAVVTGADSGMGLAVAKMLLEEGAQVLVSDKAEDSIAAAGQGLAASGEMHAVAADLTQNASVERLGQVDVLVNAAGITGPTGLFHEIDDEAWLGALDAVERLLKEERPTLELQRRGEAEEGAAAVLFPCSRHASFISGSNLRIDGGSVATV